MAGIDLAVMGIKDAVEEDDEVVSYAEPTRGIYKKLIVRNNRLAGAIVLGDSAVVPVDAPGLCRVAAAHRDALRAALHRYVLAATGAAERREHHRRDADLRLQRRQQGAIVEAVLRRRAQPQAVCDVTRAGTGCGTCRPEVERIVALACQGLAEPALLDIAGGAAGAGPGAGRRRDSRSWSRSTRSSG